jgi:hypothetical protein
MTCFCFSALKTLLTSTEPKLRLSQCPERGVNGRFSGDHYNGRFWVTTEGKSQRLDAAIRLGHGLVVGAGCALWCSTPGHFYLVQLARGAGGAASLPQPAAVGEIALSATSGKVALVRNGDLLTDSQPASAQIEDVVGYRTANFYERSPAGELSNRTAAIRRGGGCTDTAHNRDDFTVGSPQPRNTRSTLSPCVQPGGPQISNSRSHQCRAFRGRRRCTWGTRKIFGSDLGPQLSMPCKRTGDGRYLTKSLAGNRHDLARERESRSEPGGCKRASTANREPAAFDHRSALPSRLFPAFASQKERRALRGGFLRSRRFAPVLFTNATGVAQ